MKTPITNIPGIGPAIAEALASGGFASAEAIAKAAVADLSVVPGFGPVRSERVIAAARVIVPASKKKPKLASKKKDKPKAKPSKKTKSKKSSSKKKIKKGSKKLSKKGKKKKK